MNFFGPKLSKYLIARLEKNFFLNQLIFSQNHLHMKIAHVNSYDTSNTKRYKDFHEIQEDLNEVARVESKARDVRNAEKVIEFKFQDEVNKEKRALENRGPLHFLKPLNLKDRQHNIRRHPFQENHCDQPSL